MNEFAWHCVKNTALIACVAFCVWVTGSAWCILGLLLMTSYRDLVTCPRCGMVITGEDEEE